jgi:hypothetical protein
LTITLKSFGVISSRKNLFLAHSRVILLSILVLKRSSNIFFIHFKRFKLIKTFSWQQTGREFR